MKKNITKNIAGNRFIITFAMHYNHKGVTYANNRTAFFYVRSSSYIGSVPPCMSVIGILPLWCNATGKAEPFFYFQLSNYQTKNFKMHYLKSFVCRVRYTLQARTARATKCQNFHFKRLFNLVPCHVVAGQKIVRLCN